MSDLFPRLLGRRSHLVFDETPLAQSFEDPWLDAGGMPEHESSTSLKGSFVPSVLTGSHYPLLVLQGFLGVFSQQFS